MDLKITLLAFLAMIAFAANSVFCRLALVDSANNPVSFTIIRLFAGAVVLLYFFAKRKPQGEQVFSWNALFPSLALFSYALFFSLSYVKLDAGMGALILFAMVQLSMIAAALVQGQRLSAQEWFGIALAFIGFVVLVSPGISMPPILGSVFMGLSGISWACYSLLGQKSRDPVFSSSRNFLLTLPFVAACYLFHDFQLTSQGFIWAVLSGALTSALGYVIWYIVLGKLKTSTAAIIQLSVPSIAAFGGVLFLAESIELRLVLATGLVFIGILLKTKSHTH
jgi:drug/metabolite transporter (DMT)-like permease